MDKFLKEIFGAGATALAVLLSVYAAVVLFRAGMFVLRPLLFMAMILVAGFAGLRLFSGLNVHMQQKSAEVAQRALAAHNERRATKPTKVADLQRKLQEIQDELNKLS